MTCPTQLADAWRQRSGKAYRKSRSPPPRRPVTPPGDRIRAKLLGTATRPPILIDNDCIEDGTRERCSKSLLIDRVADSTGIFNGGISPPSMTTSQGCTTPAPANRALRRPVPAFWFS